MRAVALCLSRPGLDKTLRDERNVTVLAQWLLDMGAYNCLMSGNGRFTFSLLTPLCRLWPRGPRAVQARQHRPQMCQGLLVDVQSHVNSAGCAFPLRHVAYRHRRGGTSGPPAHRAGPRRSVRARLCYRRRGCAVSLSSKLAITSLTTATRRPPSCMGWILHGCCLLSRRMKTPPNPFFGRSITRCHLYGSSLRASRRLLKWPRSWLERRRI